ncbi:MAG: HPF/RaiA family ribosome-associated protein [Gemmatimonadales bacterium]|nr:HPF/RaiA family ribosome-associated protein [Gemmatimonadales bacterium]
MRTTISARHCEITDTLRERAAAIGERLAHLSPHALEATVVFDSAPEGAMVEVRLRARGKKVLIGQATAIDHMTALDRAEEKLRPQLVRVSATRVAARRTPTKSP